MRESETLRDSALEAEIALVADLVVAVSESPGPLSQRDIDRLLGVESPGAASVARTPRD